MPEIHVREEKPQKLTNENLVCLWKQFCPLEITQSLDRYAIAFSIVSKTSAKRPGISRDSDTETVS